MILVGSTLSMFAYVSGMTLAVPRMLFAFGRDGFLPAALASVHPRCRTPHVAIVVQVIVVAALALLANFEKLAVVANVTGLLVYGACCLAGAELRRRDVRRGRNAVPRARRRAWCPGSRSASSPGCSRASRRRMGRRGAGGRGGDRRVRGHAPVAPRTDRADRVSLTDDPLLRFRPEFPILESTTYLVSNSLGAMPREVPERLAEYAREWATRGVRAWAQGWWEMPVAVGDEIAPLIGAGPGEVAMVPNVSMAQAQVLSALDYAGPRDTIVMTELDFPSVRYVYDRLAARLGARIVVVPSDDGIGVSEDRLIEAIDERTRLVAMSHVLFRSAYVMDVARIAAHAHSVGALVSLDAYHSVGVLPVDVYALGADFLTGGVLKWLCGGPGGCFLWVRPEVSATLAPALTGWQAHRHPFAFEAEMEYADDAWRWLGGTPVIPALFAATRDRASCATPAWTPFAPRACGRPSD